MDKRTSETVSATLLQRGLSRRSALRWGGGLTAAAVGAGSLHRPMVRPDATSAASDGEDDIVLGALLDLTGSWASLGITSQAALEYAVEDLNAELESTGSPARVRLLVEDTQLDSDVAEEKARELADQGVRVFIGPQSSAEVADLMEYVDTSDLVLVSHGSTASELAIADDNLFRVVPPDIPEVEALVSLMTEDGIAVVVPMWLDDTGNRGLYDAMARVFPERGGVVCDGVAYAAGTVDFTEALATLTEQVTEATAEHGAGAVAVYVATFDDVVPIFNHASQAESLEGVRWYGGNGSALIEALPAHSWAGAFAVETQFRCPLFGLGEDVRDRWEPIADRIETETGQVPDGFSLAAYDAAWIVTLALLESEDPEDVAGLKEALVRTANAYDGVTGPMTLDEAGDRSTGDFDFWAIASANGGYEWQRAARFVAATGEVVHDEDTD